MTLTVGLARSEITIACRCSCETESSSQSGSTLQQFSSSSSTCSVPRCSPAVCPSSGHLASTCCTFFAVSAIFGDWHAKFWTFVFWEKLLPLFTQGLALLLAAGCGHTTCAMPMLIGWWVDMVIWLVKNG